MTNLELVDIPVAATDKNLSGVRGRLVDLLVASPGLRALGLGLDEKAARGWYDNRESEGDVEPAMRLRLCFFKTLVEEYAKKGGEPLRLMSLQLGKGMALVAPRGLNSYLSEDERRAAPKRASDFYLFKILTGKGVKVLKLETRYDWDLAFSEDLVPSDRPQAAFAWFCISRDYFPNLERGAITERTRRFDQWLFFEGDAHFLSRLELDPGRTRSFTSDGDVYEPFNAEE